MEIETDEEFVAMMRKRFASKPYTSGASESEWWTDARYEELIGELVETQREIRAAAQAPAQRSDEMSPDDWDRAVAEWAIWSIQTNDVGAYPTHWHRVWCAVGSIAAWVRWDERRRISEALRRDNAVMVGPTASELIESAVLSAGE